MKRVNVPLYDELSVVKIWPMMNYRDQILSIRKDMVVVLVEAWEEETLRGWKDLFRSKYDFCGKLIDDD